MLFRSLVDHAQEVFGLQNDIAEPFPSDLPFLWNVTPTRETWGCGYQMQSWIGIVRHLHLVALSHLTLTHHAIKRIGAQATKPHKDVPLPTFAQRITVFREDVQREQITRFANRIRQPRVRQRVKEFLLAT